MGATGGAVKVGVDSIALPGQLVAMPPLSSVAPVGFAAYGQGTQYPAPTVAPASASAALAVGAGTPVVTSVGGYSTAAGRGSAAAQAAAKPFSPRHSAVIPAVVMLVVALALLWWIFWTEDPELRRAVS